MATKKATPKKSARETTEIYIRISKGSGAKKDTIAHAADNVDEALLFIKKHG